MNMHISNANQNSRYEDSGWYFLAEFPLNDFLLDHDRCNARKGGLLFQTMRELGVPPEYIENIEMRLVGFAELALVQFEQGRCELPGLIRVFCQAKIIGIVNLAQATSYSYHTEHALEHAQMIYHSGTKVIGGWGYFLIERGGNGLTDTAGRFRNSVDLYLYKEGE